MQCSGAVKITKDNRDSVSAIRPAQVVGSIFRVRRDLVGLIKRHVMPGSGLTLEEADLLIDLFGARTMDWTDPSADADGFVAFEEVKRSLVHSAATLSRRISDLRMAGYVEIRKVSTGKKADDAVDQRKMAVRITNSGIAKIRPLYEKHCRLCERLLADIPAEDQRTLWRTNEALIKRIHWDI